MFRIVRLLTALGVACGVSICAQAAPTDPNVEVLRKRVEALEARVAALESELQANGARPAGATAPAVATQAPALAAPSAAYESEAQALINDIVRLTDQGDAESARKKLAELRTKYGASKVAGQGTYFANELEVIGKGAPADWGIETWFQGKDAIDLSGKPTTLVVFWEEWCPHCRDEMPKLQEFYATHAKQGLQVLGITKVTQTATDEKVRSFLQQKEIRFPVAKEAGGPSAYFNVKGIPAAAIVKGGKIVWRGHPIRLTEEILSRWL
jgi:thiol-disulfide isomerase/thioredoxin